MERFAWLLQHQPLIFAHTILALGALLLGAWMLAGPKGSRGHRTAGWAWVALMGGAALTSGFMRDGSMAIVAGFSPIHALTLLVMAQLPLAVWHARRGRIVAHRRTMKGLYLGGCIIAGAFTLLPGRFLGDTLWRHTLAWIA